MMKFTIIYTPDPTETVQAPTFDSRRDAESFIEHDAMLDDKARDFGYYAVIPLTCERCGTAVYQEDRGYCSDCVRTWAGDSGQCQCRRCGCLYTREHPADNAWNCGCWA